MSATAPRYAKKSGCANTLGQQLEYKMAALLFLRGLATNRPFQLASNVDGAGAFDDIIFTVAHADDVVTFYFQLKHKTNKSGVSLRMLTSATGDLSMSKYFESYKEVVTSVSTGEKVMFAGPIDSCVFVIYTNARAGGDLGPGRPIAPGSLEALVGTGHVHSFDADADADAKVLASLGACGRAGVDFLRRFRLLCNQPRESDVDAQIKAQLDELRDIRFRTMDVARLAEFFVDNVKAWWERGNTVLNEHSDLLERARRRAVVEACKASDEKTYLVDLSFETLAVAALAAGLSRCACVHVEASEDSCRLTCSKVVQAVGAASCLVLGVQTLVRNQGAVASVLGSHYATLVVVVPRGQPTDVDSCLDAVQAACAKQRVVVVCGNAEITAIFAAEDASFKDTFRFADFDKPSQRRFLKTEVCLQGCNVSLEDLLEGRRDAAGLFDAAAVVDILASDGGVAMGVGLSDGVCLTYVAQSLQRATALKDAVLGAGHLLTIIYKSVQDVQDVLLKADKSLNREVVSKTLTAVLKSSFAPLGTTKTSAGKKLEMGKSFLQRVGLQNKRAHQTTALRYYPEEKQKRGGILFVSAATERDVVTLSAIHNSQHVTRWHDKTLHWVESRGDIAFIRSYIDDARPVSLQPDDVTTVNQRIVILSGEPGMGKSTMLSRLAHTSKQQQPLAWVFLVSLHKVERLFASGKHNDALEFLVAAGDITSSVQRTLLRFALDETGNVFVLLDGFDEIAPTYVDQCLVLLTKLAETKAKRIWITSRNSVKMKLEDHLATLSVDLCRFTQQDQRLFLQRYWQSEATMAGDELDAFITRLLELTRSSVRDEQRSLLGVPLQTKMLAEIYAGHVTGAADATLPVRLDPLQLLQQFVDKKIGIYMQYRLGFERSDTNYTMHRNNYATDHNLKLAALVLILGDDGVRQLHSASDIAKETRKFLETIPSGADKTGFIDSVADGRPQFVHRVFAEYFVAKWLAENLQQNAAFLAGKLFTPAFAVVRDVLDRMLAADRKLHVAVLDEDVDEAAALLAAADVDVDAGDAAGRSALHLAAALGASRDCAENDRREALLDLLLGHVTNRRRRDTFLGRTPLDYAITSRSWLAVDKLVDSDTPPECRVPLDSDTLSHAISYDLGQLMACCLDQGLDADHVIDGHPLVHRASAVGSLRVATTLVQHGADINRLHLDMTPLQLAAANTHPDLVAFLLAANAVVGDLGHLLRLAIGETKAPADATPHLRTLTVAALLASTPDAAAAGVATPDDLGDTALHLAASHGQTAIVRALLDALPAAQRCVALRGGNLHGNTPLYRAARNGHLDTVAALLSAAPPAERAACLAARCRDGNTALHAAAAAGHADTAAALLAALPDASARAASLVSTNNMGITPLHRAALCGRLRIVDLLLDAAAETAKTVRHFALRAFIDAPAKDGRTALHFAALQRHTNVVSALIGRGADLATRDGRGDTAMHLAARGRHWNTVRVLLEGLDSDERVVAVDGANVRGEGVLHAAAAAGCVASVEQVVAAGPRMAMKDVRGRTPLMEAAANGHVGVVGVLLEAFDVWREGMSRGEFVLLRDGEGKGVLDVGSAECTALVERFLV